MLEVIKGSYSESLMLKTRGRKEEEKRDERLILFSQEE